MSDQIFAAVELTNEKVQFTGSTRDNPPVVFDYSPPFGDGQGYTGLEGLLLSFAACSGTSVVALLRRAGRSVEGLKVQAGGVRRQQHPTCLKTITLHFVVTSPDVAAADIDEAIAMSESTIAPVWAMIKGNAEITTSYEIIRQG